MKKFLFFIPLMFLFSCQRNITFLNNPDFGSLSPQEGQTFDVITNSKCIGTINLFTNCTEEKSIAYNKNDYPISVDVCDCMTDAGEYKMYSGVIVIDNLKNQGFLEVVILSKNDIPNQDFVECYVTYELQTTQKGERKKPVLVANL